MQMLCAAEPHALTGCTATHTLRTAYTHALYCMDMPADCTEGGLLSKLHNQGNNKKNATLHLTALHHFLPAKIGKLNLKSKLDLQGRTAHRAGYAPMRGGPLLLWGGWGTALLLVGRWAARPHGANCTGNVHCKWGWMQDGVDPGAC